MPRPTFTQQPILLPCRSHSNGPGWSRLLGTIVLAGGLATFVSGCHSGNNQTPAAAGGQVVTHDPVGPIPGVYANVTYRTNPVANDPVALQDGRRLFNWYNCSGCHGGHGGGGMGPSLRDPVWIYGRRDDQIFNSIAQGRSKGMPAWGTKIPEEQIWELVAYIKSMRTPTEPDPPVEPTNEEVPNPEHNTLPGVGTQTSISEAKTGIGSVPHPTEVK
jgi:cytochrome c oxidase cbb3-type subunit 3